MQTSLAITSRFIHRLTVSAKRFVKFRRASVMALLLFVATLAAIAIAKGFWDLHVEVMGPSYQGGGEIRQMFHLEECAPEGERVAESK